MANIMVWPARPSPLYSQGATTRGEASFLRIVPRLAVEPGIWYCRRVAYSICTPETSNIATLMFHVNNLILTSQSLSSNYQCLTTETNRKLHTCTSCSSLVTWVTAPGAPAHTTLYRSHPPFIWTLCARVKQARIFCSSTSPAACLWLTRNSRILWETHRECHEWV